MKVMVIVKATPSSEAGELPSQELLSAMGKYNQQLVEAGIMLAGEGLHPSSRGARIRFDGPNRTVIDGPFTETKELIAGYWMWRVESMAQAIEWLKRCPNPHPEVCELEIRPVFEAEDFGDSFTPELREQEASVRAQSLGLGALRFEQWPQMQLAGLRGRFSVETRQQIPALWDRFAPNIGAVPGQVGRKTSYGVCWNVHPQNGFDYMAAVELTDGATAPAGFSALCIEPRRYAIFTHRRSVDQLPQAIDAIWSQWAPDCGLTLAQAPCIERYTENYEGNNGLGMEICVPLE